MPSLVDPDRFSFNPFDPIQDTERRAAQRYHWPRTGFNPFDPIQDTESLSGARGCSEGAEFQPIRSDTGY